MSDSNSDQSQQDAPAAPHRPGILPESCDFILKEFFRNDAPDVKAANMVRFNRIVLEKDHPATEADYGRLDSVGVALSK